MQTLYACACDIKSNVGFFPLIIFLILSSLLRVVKVVSENKAVTRGPRRRRRRRPGTTKKKEKKNWSSSSEVSPKKNEKEKRFLDMKKTQSFDMRGHTPSKKKRPKRGRGVFTFTFFEEIFYFFTSALGKRETQKGEKTWGARKVSPQKRCKQSTKKNPIASL